MTQILIRDIVLPVTAPAAAAVAEAKKKLAPLVPGGEIVTASVYRRSVDARHSDALRFVYTVLIGTELSPAPEALGRLNAVRMEDGTLTPETGTVPLSARPVVVGFGPGGMFAALLLAEQGYRPLVLERGEDTAERQAAVERFYRTKILDPSTNIQFGAGGAGTFSDGKLVTRINDPKCRWVLERFAGFGAPAEILTEAKPHVGTDRLLGVVGAIRDRIRSLGGEILFRTAFLSVKKTGERVTAVVTDRGEIQAGAVILAIGHSARDTAARLIADGFSLVPKPFSVGVRIEHLQEDIDRAMYGKFASRMDRYGLKHAEYAFSRRVGNECVYTFCMCPGGEVVAAASEEGGVVTNGMSRYLRDGRNANAAIAVAVEAPEPVEFQRGLERAAFRMGGGEYRAPMQTVGDFLSGSHGKEPGRVLPTYMNGNVTPCDLHGLFPDRVSSMLELGIRDFDRKLHGFASPDAILTAAETRTSSPLRILREPGTLTAPGCVNLYPCGEGAGYAGGITSAAVDGLSCALALMKENAPAKGAE